MNIPFKKLNLDDKVINAVVNTLRSGNIGLGNEVFEFEKMLAKYVGAKHVIATDSCTSAIFLSLKYDDVKVVGVPSMTVPLVPAAVVEAGKELVLTDDVGWVGSAYRLQGTNIWDSAHQLDKDQMKNTPDAQSLCFSFYPTKSIGSADGGAIATNDDDFADWARTKSSYGRDQKAKYQDSWEYEVVTVGYKRHYTNLQAVICREQLEQLPKIDKRRVEIRDKYNKAFDMDNRSLYLYRLSVGNRNRFIKDMAKKGITCGVHFKPVHLFKAFKDFPFFGDRGRVEKNYELTVSLPFYNLLTDQEVDYIIGAII